MGDIRIWKKHIITILEENLQQKKNFSKTRTSGSLKVSNWDIFEHWSLEFEKRSLSFLNSLYKGTIETWNESTVKYGQDPYIWYDVEERAVVA